MSDGPKFSVFEFSAGMHGLLLLERATSRWFSARPQPCRYHPHHSFEDNPTTSSTTVGRVDTDQLYWKSPLRKAALRGESVRTTFAGPSVLFPGPFGYSPTLGLQLPPNNPVKNLQWAAVIPMTAAENRLRSRGAPLMRTKPSVPFGKHFYSLPRISTRVPARHRRIAPCSR